MSAKKLDLGKAIERERSEPKLSEEQASKQAEEKKDKNSQPFEIRLKSELVEEKIDVAAMKIKIGMAADKVIKAAGKPHSTFEWYAGNLKYNYGNVWVVMENGVVTCLVHDKHFEKYWGLDDYRQRNPGAIIK
jgi:hypothetical protein